MTDKLIEQLRDEDSYYRVQEKHWCIDGEELERQRLAAADRIEAQATEIAELKSWKAAEEAHHHKLRAEIERLRMQLKAAALWTAEPGTTIAEIRAALGETT